MPGLPERLLVTSPDGTPLAVWVDGGGPPLVMVHGAVSDHTNDAPFVAALRDRATTFAMDRRGRGESGDAPAYAIDREFEDVSAVVDMVAERIGSPVSVWGHSYGADVAMGAATRTNNIRKLVLYEPGLGIVPPAGSIELLEKYINEGDLESATISLLREIVGLTESELELTRSLPTWSKRVALVSSVPRELSTEASWVYESDQFSKVAADALVLGGSESPPDQSRATNAASDAIPGARVQILHGHSHIAHRTDPQGIADVVLAFITDR